jgi:hypothetical protein
MPASEPMAAPLTLPSRALVQPLRASAPVTSNAAAARERVDERLEWSVFVFMAISFAIRALADESGEELVFTTFCG